MRYGIACSVVDVKCDRIRLFFFFQAEDGIRDLTVTGVQTCALPISRDVKASFDRVLDPERKLTARGSHVQIKNVEVLDDHTARFKTDGPYPLFVEDRKSVV